MIVIDEPALPARPESELREKVAGHATRSRRRRRVLKGTLGGLAMGTAIALFAVTAGSSGGTSTTRTTAWADDDDSDAQSDNGRPTPESWTLRPTPDEVIAASPKPSTTLPQAKPSPPRSSSPPVAEKAVIAFVSASNLTVMSLDGTNRRVLDNNASAPSWAPNGKQLVYVRGTDLWEYDLATDERRLRFHRDDYQVTAPSWSPDGSFVAFAMFGTQVGSLDTSGKGLWLFDTRTGEARRLRLGEHPSVRRDGTIVYECSGKLCLTDATGADRGVVPGSDGHRLPEWSPDGRTIAAISPDHELVVFGADGSARRVVTSRVTWKPTWFPDGSRLAFVLDSVTSVGCPSRPCGSDDGIWSVRSDGSEPRPLVEGMENRDPAISAHR